MLKKFTKQVWAWMLTVSILVATLPTGVFSAGGKTIYTNLEYKGVSSGTKSQPYSDFADAVKAASDGDTIVIQGKGFINGDEKGEQPLVIDKSIAVTSQSGVAELYVRSAGIVLAADVTMANIELNLANKYHNAIFVNGHNFAATNVTRGAGSREVHLFAGGIGTATGLTINAVSGNSASITLTSSEFGNIYAGGMAKGFDGDVSVTLSQCKAGSVYGSGTPETLPTGGWFDVSEPKAPAASAVYSVGGSVSICTDGISTSAVDGTGAANVSLTLNDAQEYRAMTLRGIDALTVNGGTATLKALDITSAVTLSNSAELNLSGVADASGSGTATVSNLSGEGKLILGRLHKLVVTGSLNGNFVFETANGFNGASGVASYDHVYITSGGGNANVTFKPHPTQSAMTLDKTANEWRTSALRIPPSAVKTFAFTQSSVTVDFENFRESGLTLPVVWGSSEADSDLSSLAYIPFRYEVNYNGALSTGTASASAEDEMYSVILTINNNAVEFAATDGIPGDSENPDGILVCGTLSAGVYQISVFAPSIDGGEIKSDFTLIIREAVGKKQSVTSITAGDVSFGDSLRITANVIDKQSVARRVTGNAEQISAKSTLFPVTVLQKTGSDADNLVLLFVAEGYRDDSYQQNVFLNTSKKYFDEILTYEPYKRVANRINAYAVHVASNDYGIGDDKDTYFGVTLNGMYPWLKSGQDDAEVNTIIKDLVDNYLDSGAKVNNVIIQANHRGSTGVAYPWYSLCICTRDGAGKRLFYHELGHSLGNLADEYTQVVGTENPNTMPKARLDNLSDIKWRKLLGFRYTYVLDGGSKLYIPSADCLMIALEKELCEVCKLHLVRLFAEDGYMREMKNDIYVAVPTVMKAKDNIDFTNTSLESYSAFKADYDNRLVSKEQYNPSELNGETIELRTIVQNLSPTAARNVTLKLFIETADGKIMSNLTASKDFVIPERKNPEDYNSGLENCTLKMSIPSDAGVADGDKVRFSVVDKDSGEVFATEATENQKYAPVRVRYLFEGDNKSVPDTIEANVPVAVGSVVNWTAPQTVSGYSRSAVKTNSGDVTVTDNGADIVYYYTNTNDDSEPVPGGNVQFFLNGEKLGDEAAVNSSGAVSLVAQTALSGRFKAGQNELRAVYSGDDNYEPSVAVCTFTVRKANNAVLSGFSAPSDSAFDKTSHVGELNAPEVSVNGFVLDKNPRVTVEYLLDGKSTASPVFPGSYSIRLKVAEGDKFESFEQDGGSFTIDKATPAVVVSAEDKGNGDVELTATVTGIAPYTPSGSVVFTWDGGTLEKALSNSAAVCTVRGVKSREYSYKAAYVPSLGDAYYHAATSAENKITPVGVSEPLKLPVTEELFEFVSPSLTYTGDDLSLEIKKAVKLKDNFVGKVGTPTFFIMEDRVAAEAVNAGEYDVYVTCSEGAEYAALTSPLKLFSVTISPKLLSNADFTQNANPVYSGAAQNVPITVKTGIVRDRDYTIKGIASLTDVSAEDVIAVVEGKGNYNGIVSFRWNLKKATPSGAPQYIKISESGKTLADAKLKAGGMQPAGGSIKWLLPDGTEVQANTFYEWRYTPADSDNYETLIGSVKLWQQDSSSPGESGGGGGSNNKGSNDNKSAEEKESVVLPSSIIVGASVNGTATLSESKAVVGTKVTIAVKPNRGYELDSISVKSKYGDSIFVGSVGNNKYEFTMPSADVIVEVSFKLKVEPVRFSDVDDKAYYYDAVKWAVENKITEGTEENIFSPEAVCSRAQMITFLWRASGSPEPRSLSNPFKDIASDAYYFKAVLWAAENGIALGVDEASFSPDSTVARAQTVTFLSRVAKSSAAHDGSFSDVAADAYYAGAVAWAKKNGITSGTEDGKFSPNASCTRAQIVTFIYRAQN